MNTVDWLRAIKSLCHTQFDGSSCLFAKNLVHQSVNRKVLNSDGFIAGWLKMSRPTEAKRRELEVLGLALFGHTLCWACRTEHWPQKTG